MSEHVIVGRAIVASANWSNGIKPLAFMPSVIRSAAPPDLAAAGVTSMSMIHELNESIIALREKHAWAD